MCDTIPAANPTTPRKPLFSIIVPTRDRPLLLERALLQVKSQTCEDFEVIVVDDGSTGDTISRYAELWKTLDPRFTMVVNSNRQGSGPSAVRNQGLKLALGELIAFCDDDDYWCDPRHLEIAAKALASAPNANLYFANQRGVNSDDVVTIPDWMPQVSQCLAGRPRIGQDKVFLIGRADLLKEGGQVGHVNTAILRRRVVEETNGFWEGIRYEEDREFLLRAVDRSEQLLYRSDVTAVHNVPDDAARTNASTRLNALDKWLVRLVMTQHVMLNARSPDVLCYARMLAGHAYRHVATHYADERRYADAWRSALCALASRGGFKWAVYTLYLMARSVIGKRSS